MMTTSADPHASQEDIVIEVLKDFPTTSRRLHAVGV